MGKFDMDLSGIAKVVCPDQSKIPLKGNEDRLVRVAFDLFRLKGDEDEQLWQVQADDDGIEFLVRTYNLPEEDSTKIASDWSIMADKHANLTIAYRGIPISKVAGNNYNANSPEDIELLRQTLYTKLSTNESFVEKFINSLPMIKRNALQELGIFVKNAKDPLGLGKVMRMEKKYKEHLDPAGEKELKRIIEKYFGKKNKLVEKKEQDASLAETFEENIPENLPERHKQLDSMTDEQRDILYEALSHLPALEEEVFTSAREASFNLSKRSVKLIDKRGEELEQLDKELSEVLEEVDEPTDLE